MVPGHGMDNPPWPGPASQPKWVIIPDLRGNDSIFPRRSGVWTILGLFWPFWGHFGQTFGLSGLLGRFHEIEQIVVRQCRNQKMAIFMKNSGEFSKIAKSF